MSALLTSLGIDRLSRDEKLTLVQELWDDIASSPGTFLTDAQKHELDRRAAEEEATPDDGIPWEQVKAAMLARLARK